MEQVDQPKPCQTSLYHHRLEISQIPAFHKEVVSRQMPTDSRHKANGVHQIQLVTEIKAEMVVVETADLLVVETEVEADMVVAEMAVVEMEVAETVVVEMVVVETVAAVMVVDMVVAETVAAVMAVEKVVDMVAVKVAVAVVLEVETVEVELEVELEVDGMVALVAEMVAEKADLAGETVDHVSVVYT